MKAGWKLAPFEVVVRSRGSGATGLPTSEWLDSGAYPVVGQGAQDIEGWTDRLDLLLTPTSAVVLYGGHTRRAKHVEGPFVAGPNVKILEPAQGLDSRFLFYFLTYLPIESKGYADHFPLVRKSYVPVPPENEQRRIVAILDEAFQGIATTKANAERNLQNAQAVFESHVERVFARSPDGWRLAALGELCQVKTGKKDVNQGNPGGQFPFFTCAAEHTYSDSYSFDAEALLVAGNGNVGQVSYYSGKFEAYQRTYVLFGFNDVTAKYLYRVLDKRLSATVSKQKLGNTMPYIKIGMLTNFIVPVPCLAEQHQISSELDLLAHETDRLKAIYLAKDDALIELKKSLLHQAFTGAL